MTRLSLFISPMKLGENCSLAAHVQRDVQLAPPTGERMALFGGVVPALQDRAISICWPSAEKRKFVFAVRTQGAHKTVPAEDS